MVSKGRRAVADPQRGMMMEEALARPLLKEMRSRTDGELGYLGYFVNSVFMWQQS